MTKKRTKKYHPPVIFRVIHPIPDEIGAEVDCEIKRGRLTPLSVRGTVGFISPFAYFINAMGGALE